MNVSLSLIEYSFQNEVILKIIILNHKDGMYRVPCMSTSKAIKYDDTDDLDF